MFKCGDLIIYGNTGVCRVVDINTPDFATAEDGRLYYMLEPLHQNGVIYTPLDTKVFMRPIISKDEACKLIESIPDVETEIYHNPVFTQLAEHYEAILRTHDCADLTKLAMSIYAKKKAVQKSKRKLGAVDQKYMKRAEELLFGELSAALQISKDSVPQFIEAKVGTLEDI